MPAGRPPDGLGRHGALGRRRLARGRGGLGPHRRDRADHRRAGDVPRSQRPGLHGRPRQRGTAGAGASAGCWPKAPPGPFFDLFILLANPSSQAADVRLRFLLGDGTVIEHRETVPALSRGTVWVDALGRDAGPDRQQPGLCASCRCRRLDRRGRRQRRRHPRRALDVVARRLRAHGPKRTTAAA